MKNRNISIKSNEFIYNKSVIILSFKLRICLCCVCGRVNASVAKREWVIHFMYILYSFNRMPHEPFNVNNGVQRLSNDAYGISSMLCAHGLHEASYKCAYNNSCFPLSPSQNKTIVCNTTIMITLLIGTTATQKQKHMIVPKLRHKNLESVRYRSNPNIIHSICIWHKRILKNWSKL